MARNEKLSTCPVCGYTDTASDAQTLHEAINEHIRMAHNLDPATLSSGPVVKDNRDITTGDEDSGEATNLANNTAGAYGLGIMGRGPAGGAPLNQ